MSKGLQGFQKGNKLGTSYRPTEAHKRKLSKLHKNKVISETTKTKISKTVRKRMPEVFNLIEIEAKKLESQGYRVIPITHVIPDIIAIKDNKVYAIEVESGKTKPNYAKYTDKIKKRFDDIVWIIKEK